VSKALSVSLDLSPLSNKKRHASYEVDPSVSLSDKLSTLLDPHPSLSASQTTLLRGISLTERKRKKKMAVP
jgi:hypothetical protein